MYWVALIRTSSKEGVVLYLDREDCKVMVWMTGADALRHFEAGYRESLGRGGGWAAGAIINWLQFQPSIIEIESADSLKERLFNKESKMETVDMSSVAGFLTAALIPNQEAAIEAWEKGAKPVLAKEKTTW